MDELDDLREYNDDAIHDMWVDSSYAENMDLEDDLEEWEDMFDQDDL